MNTDDPAVIVEPAWRATPGVWVSQSDRPMVRVFLNQPAWEEFVRDVKDGKYD